MMPKSDDPNGRLELQEIIRRFDTRETAIGLRSLASQERSWSDGSHYIFGS